MIWLHAARPRTLGASLIPVAVGSAAAAADTVVRLDVTLLCSIAALSLQVGTNLVNDALDFVHGIDGLQRTGPLRVTLAGWLSPSQVLGGAGAAFALATACGAALVQIGGAPILWIGLAALVAAVAYSAGPFPLASHGLGEAAAFVFFGLVAVNGTAYLHTGRLSELALWTSVPVAALVAGLMTVNNLRDIETDRASGKRTLVVRMGARATRAGFAGLLALAFGWPLVLWLAVDGRLVFFLPWLALPLAISLARVLFQATTADEFNRALAGAARLHGVYGLLLAVGLVLG